MAQCTYYLRVDELALISLTAEEINTPLVQTVSGNDSAIHIDGKANIRSSYSDREEV
jgi:hypothetical protein